MAMTDLVLAVDIFLRLDLKDERDIELQELKNCCP